MPSLKVNLFLIWYLEALRASDSQTDEAERMSESAICVQENPLISSLIRLVSERTCLNSARRTRWQCITEYFTLSGYAFKIVIAKMLFG